MQYTFLRDAWGSFNPPRYQRSPSVILALGGRVPLALIQQMFEECGYAEYEELTCTLKRQSQPEWVLEGYSKAEQKHGVEFDFYNFERAKAELEKNHLNMEGAERIPAELKKAVIQKHRMSASEAWDYHRHNYPHVGKHPGQHHIGDIGHLVQIQLCNPKCNA